MSGRTPEQEGANQCDEHSACELELGRAPALGKGFADDSEAGEDQDEGEPDMREREDSPVGDAFPEHARLAEVVGHQHRLAGPASTRARRQTQIIAGTDLTGS